MQIVSFSLLAASGLGVFVCGDYTPQFQHEGRAHVAQLGKRMATLQGTCHLWGRPTFELELHLQDVESQDLPRDALADSRASQSDAVTLVWATGSKRAQLVAATTQQPHTSSVPLQPGEEPGREHVVVMVEDVSSSDAGADFFGSLEAEPGDFSWRQSGTGDAQVRVDASFALSAADAVAMRDAALHCRNR